MSPEYIQFTILHILYDYFIAAGESKDTRVSQVIDNAELNYLDDITVSAEIDYLAGKKFIMGSSSTGQSPYSWIKISSSGIDIIRFILRHYPLFLSQLEDAQCKQKCKLISAIKTEKGRRLEIYGFINDKPNYFEDFLEKTNAISLTPIPYIPSKTQIRNEANEQVQNNNIQEKNDPFALTRSCMNFKICNLLTQNINQNNDTKYQQSISLLLTLLNFPTVNLGSFGNEGEQIKDSRVQSFSCDIISFVSQINSCLIIDCTLSVPTEEKINRIHNTTSYLEEKLSAKLIPVIISAARVPSKHTATTAKVRVIDKLELNNLVDLVNSGDITEAQKQFLQILL